MGYRVFKDSQGTEWQTWDVVPQLAERRRGDRRHERAEKSASDRRLSVERRILIGRRPGLGTGLDGGWLCFEAPVEKRRLTPIPADWLRCSEPKLEQYCRDARPAVRRASPIDISAISLRTD